ncbi:MAG: hypothetical protein ACLP4V_22285 [Methylocella sp.]
MGESKRRRDNPELARAAANRDANACLLELARMGGNSDVGLYGPHGIDTSKITPDSVVFLTVGSRGDLTEQRAKDAAEAFRRIRKKAGPGMVELLMTGYDEDPRPIAHIPEAAAYYALWQASRGRMRALPR